MNVAFVFVAFSLLLLLKGLLMPKVCAGHAATRHRKS